MRSLLFVPGNDQSQHETALASGADALILDLERSVAAEDKPAAREAVRAFLKSRLGRDGPLLYVRVNGLGTGMMGHDLAAIMPARPHGVVLPGSGGADDVLLLSARLRVYEAEHGIKDRATRILPLMETAAALLAASSHARPVPRLSAIGWDAEQLSADIGARAPHDADAGHTGLHQFARSITLLTAAAAGVGAIDTLHPDAYDETRLARRCAEAAHDGFSAKLANHPAQIPVINAAFTPPAKSPVPAQPSQGPE